MDTPRLPGPTGQFLREFAAAKLETAKRLGVSPVERKWVSGEALGPINLTPVTQMQLSRGNELMGSVASVIVGSETLGCTFRVSLWSAARTANRLQRIWRRDPGRVVTLSGPYRWHPPGRITPGEATTDEQPETLGWHQLRSLKYTGDDLGRPAGAAAHHLDWFIQPPGMKTFRAFAIRRDAERWSVLPGLRKPSGALSVTVPHDFAPPHASQLLALGYAEPWAPDHWRVVDAVTASDHEVLGHNLAWADHLRELRDESAVSAAEAVTLHRRLREAGLAPSRDAAARTAELTRRLRPAVREFAGWLRGTS